MLSKFRLNRILLEAIAANSGVTADMVIDAIDNQRKIIIQYLSDGEDRWKGPRVVEIYAYGTSKTGNPVFRGFQQYGDSKKHIYKGWKLFRLDRILSWKDSGQTFEVPTSFGQYGAFNPNGDRTMASVYHILKLDNNDAPKGTNGPKMKTSTESGMERLKQQLANPIYLKDIMKKEPTSQSFGPKKKEELARQTKQTPYNLLKGKEREEYRAWKELKDREAERQRQMQSNVNNEPIDRLSDEFYKDYERKVGRQQAERDKRALGTTGPITKEKLANAQGAVDRMKKYHKDSANDFIRNISDEVMNRIIKNFADQEKK